jgi:signal peptidase I
MTLRSWLKSMVSHSQLRSVGSFILVFALAILFRTVCFEMYYIPSASMYPTLVEGDYVVIAKYPYGFSRYSVLFHPPLGHGRLHLGGGGPQRGDIVVFHSKGTVYIKRLIGLPGDRVAVVGGHLWLNGTPVERHFEGVQQDSLLHPVMLNQERLDNGRVFHTYDHGPMGRFDDFPPTQVPEGHYFMMGDNRDNSDDSRNMGPHGIGFVSEESLIGRADYIAFSFAEPWWKFWRWPSTLQWKRFFTSTNMTPYTTSGTASSRS